jgi:transketolase
VRRTVVEALADLAAADERIVLLTGDLGFTVVETFAERFPARFFNMGVAEQNMLGVATGLAEAGYVPYVYSIATFATLRPYEFFRNGAVHHDLPVRVLGIGAGFDYGSNGISHFALEDIAVMRAQPGVAVVVPADAAQARACLGHVHRRPGPVYLRLGKDENARIPGLDGRFAPDEATIVDRTGGRVLLLGTGAVSSDAVAAAERLRSRGISATTAVVASLAPAPAGHLAELIEASELVVTVEAHYTTGGLGSMVAEIIADEGLGTRLVRAGVDRRVGGVVGDTRFLLDRFGLSAESLSDAARAALGGRTPTEAALSRAGLDEAPSW